MSQPNRYISLDVARGSAIVIMVIAHLSIPNEVTEYSRALASPFFLIVAGISYGLFLENRTKISANRRRVFAEVISRGAILSLITLLPSILGSTLYPEHYRGISIWNVFQVISVGYVVGYFLSWRGILPALAIPVVFLAHFVGSVVLHLGFLEMGLFPVVPYVAYFFVGQFMSGALYIATPSRNVIKSIAVVALLLDIFLIALYSTGGVALDKALQDSPEGFALIACLQLSLLTCLILLDNSKTRLANLLGPIEGIGRIAFTAYYVHLLLVAVTLEVAVASVGSPLPSLLLPILVLANVAVLSLVEMVWRKWNYRYGVEWILRRGATILVSRFPTLLASG